MVAMARVLLAASAILFCRPCSSFVLIPAPAAVLPSHAYAGSAVVAACTRSDQGLDIRMGARSEALGWLKRNVLAGSALLALSLASPLPSRAAGGASTDSSSGQI